jgi:hypothetical protein
VCFWGYGVAHLEAFVAKFMVIYKKFMDTMFA